MDATVLRAMAKWPNVPACHGWLFLDARGQWRVGERRERILHAGLIEFIDRNYAPDERGAWFFQNGPQRVFVTLEYTPYVYRFAAHAPAALETHTGLRVERPAGVWLDEHGSLLLATEHGIGVLLDRDLPRLLERLRDAGGERAPDAAIEALLAGEGCSRLALDLCAAQLAVAPIRRDQVPARFGFLPSPAPP